MHVSHLARMLQKQKLLEEVPGQLLLQVNNKALL